MLKELSHYENLGTPQYFRELFHILGKNNQTWTIKEIKEFFFNRVVEGRRCFDGCLPFAIFLGIVQVKDNKKTILNPTFVELVKASHHVNTKVLERLFQELKNDEVFYEIFCSQNISYDIIYHSIQICNSAFQFKYANFKQFLIDFDFLHFHPNKQTNKYVINKKYKNIFDKTVLPEIKKRRIGLEELGESLELQKAYGEEAEIFVLHFEEQRLGNKQGIDRISEYWANAGYDIASYDDIESEAYNRFIEVKSYSGAPNFYWSRNEIETASLKKDKYFLYLVNRDQMKCANYKPIILQNPYLSVLKHDLWNKQVEKYFISMKEEK